MVTRSRSDLESDTHLPRQSRSARNLFERFRGFLFLISRFEFDCCRCGNYFLNDSNFWCSKFNHTQCGRTCACAVACLCPQISNSNDVVSVTIHDNVHIDQRCSKNMKPLWKVVQIVRYTWVLVANDKLNHPAADSLRSVPQESWS